MNGLALASRLTAALPSGMPGLFNPWSEICEHDLKHNGPSAKLARLAAHLSCVPRFVFFGEAAGHLGCRHSGIAFTSERLLAEGAIPRIAATGRLTSRRLPFSEPSATIVWKALYGLGIADHTIMWNALQLHPFKSPNINNNRTPSPAEMALGAKAVRILLDAFPSATVIAVGKKADGLLRQMGVSVAGQVRHPANGGATAFAAETARLVAQTSAST